MRISIVSLTMPLTHFLFAAHFRNKKNFKRNNSKTTPARKLILFLQKTKQEKVFKKEIKKNCKIFDGSFLQHAVALWPSSLPVVVAQHDEILAIKTQKSALRWCG